MNIQWNSFNWFAIAVAFVLGQAFLTLWFAALFAKPWAREYGVESSREHARAIPAATYALGAVCLLLLVIGLETLIVGFSADTFTEAVFLGTFVSVHFSVATALPGYAFLKRYRAFALALGSQFTLIVLLSVVLASFH